MIRSRSQKRQKAQSRLLPSLLWAIYAFFSLTLVAVAQTPSSLLRVVAEDEANQLIAGARVEIKQAGNVLSTTITNEKGEVEFSNLSPGSYEVTIAKEGFETLTKHDVSLMTGASVTVKFTLVPKIELKEDITIKGDITTPVAEGATTASGEFQRKELYDLANKPANVADTLPLIPGVARSPNGEINISGSGEHRSALIVNSADVTDPATGQFGMTIPVDIVERIEVFKSPFLAQYGRFTAGVVSVETRRGGEKWNFEVHDPLPAFRFRSARLAGMLNASPRIVFNGPLIKDRLYLSEGVEYRIFKDPVRTLDHPNREMKAESVNSFTQLDYIVSPTHTLTGTLHVAPRKILYANLNFFDPRPVSANFSSRDYTGTLMDRLAIGNHLLESTFAVKQYGSDVWGQGRAEMTLTPTGNHGNYWNEQDRHASRFEWIEQFTPRSFNWLGAHNLRFGGAVARTRNWGEFFARPVNITNIDGQLLRRIEFVGGSKFAQADTEFSAYGQNNWVLNQQFAINFGARFEKQQITSALRLAPRFGFSWSPFNSKNTVVRGGIGVFYDRIPLSIYIFDRYPEQVITTYDASGAVIDGPRQYANIVGRTEDDFPLIRAMDRAGNFSPHTTTWKLEVEHSVGSLLRLRANYLQSQSGGLVILTPKVVEGRDALFLSGGGNSRYRQFELTARLKWSEEENLILSYVRSRARGDLNEFDEYLGNFPSPVVRPNQYSNLSADLPHRFLAHGLIKLPWRMRIAPLIEYRNGLPYAVTNVLHQYVGVPNSDHTRFPNFYSLDLRIMKDFDITYKNKKYTTRISFMGYNVTNHFNPWDVHRNIADPQFGVFFGRYRRWFKMDFEFIF